jgi:hypothetical protein
MACQAAVPLKLPNDRASGGHDAHSAPASAQSNASAGWPRLITFRCSALLAGNLVIVRMTSDPEPLDTLGSIVAKRAMMRANAHRPKFPEALEMKRWMSRIGLEKLEVLVGDCTTGFGSASYSAQKRPDAVCFKGAAFFLPCGRPSILR